MNVDLDVEGPAAALAGLVDELDRRLLCLNKESVRGRRTAHYESRRQIPTIEATLRALLTVIERLPDAAKRGWSAARVRDFNVGMQAGRLPHAHESAITAATLARVAALGGRLVLTIYASFPRPRARAGSMAQSAALAHTAAAINPAHTGDDHSH